MPTLHRYVVGFCFDFGYHHVLLIEKNRPPWQAGKLNGLGGKIEVGESPVAAMAREFREETEGLGPVFTPYSRLTTPNSEVWFFHAKIDEFPAGIHNKEVDGEILQVLNRDDVDKWPVVPNVRVYLPIAVNHARRLDAAEFFEVRECRPPADELLGTVRKG